MLCDAMLCSVKCTSVKLNQSDNNPVVEGVERLGTGSSLAPAHCAYAPALGQEHSLGRAC